MTITLVSADATAARVTIQTTPAPKLVPDIRDLTPSAASDQLVTAGFQTGTITKVVDPSCSHLGLVISQSATPGTRLPPGTRISFTYGTEPSGPPGTPLPC